MQTDSTRRDISCRVPVRSESIKQLGVPRLRSLSRTVTRGDLIDILRVHEDQATTLFVEEPSIRSFFDRRAVEGVAIAHLYHHRRWRIGHVDESLSGTTQVNHHPTSRVPATHPIAGIPLNRLLAIRPLVPTARQPRGLPEVIRTIPAKWPGQFPRERAASPDHSAGGPHPPHRPRPPRQIPY